MKKLLIIALSLIIVMGSCKKEDLKPKVIEVSTVKVDFKTLSLIEGEEKQLIANVLPENATVKTILWSSSDEATATISDQGLIKSIKAGSVNIIAESVNHVLDTCKLTVSQDVINVTGVKIDVSESDLKVGKTKQISITITPETATNKNIVWNSSDEAIATVSEEGLVTAIKVGKVKITVVTEDGNKTANLDLNIIPASVEQVIIKSYSHYLRNSIYYSCRLTAIVLPEESKDKSYTWTSSNEDVATIAANGDVTAKSVGTTTMTVTTIEGGKTATYDMHVIDSYTIKDYLIVYKRRNDDKKAKGQWISPKLIFEVGEADIDMDYSFSYDYRKSEATIDFNYEENGEIIIHSSLVQFSKTGFVLENPLSINGKQLSEFNYNVSDKSFSIVSDNLIGMLDAKINGVPVYSDATSFMRHRHKSGDLETNYSSKMWSYRQNCVELIGLEEDKYDTFKFEFNTYDEEVAYEGSGNFFLITYYLKGQGTRRHYFNHSKDYTFNADGSIVFNKSDENWYDESDSVCEKISQDENTKELLNTIFSTKGWKVITEYEDECYVIISNEDPNCWLRLWVHYDEWD